MTSANIPRFTLAIPGRTHDFQIHRFDVTEDINTPFCVDIKLVSDRHGVDLESFLHQPAKLTYGLNGEKFHGLIHANETLSVFITLSSLTGNGSNELRIEDRKGAEEIYLHAERDWTQHIKHDQIIKVGNERHDSVGANSITELKAEEHHITHGNRVVQVKGSDHLEVADSIHIKTGKAQLVETDGEMHIRSKKAVIEAGAELTFTAGGNFLTIRPDGLWFNGLQLHINEDGEGTLCEPAQPLTPLHPRAASGNQAGHSTANGPPSGPATPPASGASLTAALETKAATPEPAPETITIMPLARLPGHVGMHDTPRGALLRPGRLYIFRKGILWREHVCDGQGNLFEVDLPHWRQQAEQGLPADDRPGIGLPHTTVELPVSQNGRMVADDLLVAYSETPWSWEYISEFNATRGAKYRGQKISPAWAAAMRTEYPWRTAQETPAILIDGYATGFRPRDFNIETLLEDPATFTPDLAGFPDDSLFSQLHQRQTELALAQGEPAPDPMPAFEAHPNILVEKKLYGLPKLAGLLIHDPLFDARHAAAQIRLAQQQLQTLNALVLHQPNGQYAQFLYSTLMRPEPNPMAEYRFAIKEKPIAEAVLEPQRTLVRQHMAKQLTQLIRLVDKRLPKVFQDWHVTRDERLVEPFALLAELFTALVTLPVQSDPLCITEETPAFQEPLDKLLDKLLAGEHPLTQDLFDSYDEDKPQLERFIGLINQRRQLAPERMGLSSLVSTLSGPMGQGEADPTLVYKSVHGFVDDILNNFNMATNAVVARLARSLVRFDLRRTFAPTYGLLSKLSPAWHEFHYMPRAMAQAQGMVIMGVQGGGLSNGLFPEEVALARKQNFAYAAIKNKEGLTVASTSPKVMPNTPDHGSSFVLAVAKDHPDVEKFRTWKLDLLRPVRAVVESKTFPAIGAVAAFYNLTVQMHDMKWLLNEQTDAIGRFYAGVASAVADTVVALGTLAKPFLGDGHRLSILLNASTLDVSGISERWAATLERLTGDPRLPILRLANGFALAVTVAVYSWDSVRAFRQGDRDSGLAYSIAAAGGVLALMGAISFFALPIALAVLGWSLLIGGAAVGAWLADSPLVTLLNNGPFGRIQSPDSQFDYLQDEQVAYNQLVGIFGAPQLKAWRLSDWLLQATAEQQEMLEAIHQEKHRTYNKFEHRQRPSCMPLTGEDWVITVASPLLAMCSSTRGLQLKVEERLTRHTYSLDGIADTGVEQRETLTRAKASAFPVDPTTLMWVLPPQFPASAITEAQRDKAYYTHGLTLRLQMYLGGIEACEPNSLVLPQPTPTYWRPFVPDDMNPPKNRANATDVPYWLIHDETFRK